MAWWLGKRAWRRVSWKTVGAVAVWLVEQGRERFQSNLTEREQRELLNIIKKSKGLPGNLSQRDRARLKSIAGKAIRG